MSRRNEDDRASNVGARLTLIIVATLIAVMAVGWVLAAAQNIPLGSMLAAVTGAPRWEVPATPDLETELREAADPLARQRAAWWLGEHESYAAVPALEAALRDRSPEVRVTAAWALGEIKDPDSIPALTATLGDTDPLVREMAILALGEIERQAAVRPIVDAVTAEPAQRAAAVWALGEIGSRDAEEARAAVFREWGRSPWPNEQIWTGTLKGNLGCVVAVGGEIERLQAAESGERREAALCLGRLGVRYDYRSLDEALSAVDELLAALGDPAPEVRAAAVWSLDEINPSRTTRKRRHDDDHEH